MPDQPIPVMENPAETMRKTLESLGQSEFIEALPLDKIFSKTHHLTVAKGRDLKDITDSQREAAQYLKPARREGTATLTDLNSIIDWANRFKGPDSALFAMPDKTHPKLTCITDYHIAGPPDPVNPIGDPTARHCHHRGIYNFPLSDEWKTWMKISGEPLEKDGLGEFIEANAKDIMNPTPAILAGEEHKKNQGFENRLIRTAQQIEGRYGQLKMLLAMSRQFQVFETSDLTVTSNRDTGEGTIKFINEHNGVDGKPINIPNLIIIAIPVFQGGPLYRMPVRFRYRKSGKNIRFIMTIYTPEKSFDAAFDEAIAEVTEKTALPMFKGSPET